MSTSSYERLNTPPIEKSSFAGPLASRNGLKSWASAVWPLALHSIIAVAIAASLVFSINGTEFGLTDRWPSLPIAYGQFLDSNKHIILQSDIVTLLSAAIVLLRWVLAAWSTAFCWHSALFLMSKRGLLRRELKSMVGLGALKPNSTWGDADKALIGAALLFNFVASSVAPLLTGSVSWLPSSRVYSLEHHAPLLNVSYVENNTTDWNFYMTDTVFRRSIYQAALGHATLAWGREVDKNSLKRVVPSTNGLQVGSNIAEVVMPYFSVNHIEWLHDLPNNSTPNSLNNHLIRSVNSGPLEPGDFRLIQGYISLVPESYWPNSTTRSFPSSETVEKTQLALFNFGLVRNGPMSFADSSFPPLYNTTGFHHGFAMINYTAGVARCYNCSITSPSTVRSETNLLSPEKDSMTQEALRLAPVVISSLVTMNSSIPFPTNCSLNDYVTALLTRSYSASWAALTDTMDINLFQSTTYSPAVPSLKAQVDFVRVCIWLVFQMLVTLFGIGFLVLHNSTGNILPGDTTLLGFYLDTTDVPVSGRALAFRQGNVLRLRPNGDRLKVDLEKVQ